MTVSKPLISTPQSRNSSGTYRSGMLSASPERGENVISCPNHSPDAFDANEAGNVAEDVERPGEMLGSHLLSAVCVIMHGVQEAVR